MLSELFKKPGTEIAARDRPDARGRQGRRRAPSAVPRDGRARRQDHRDRPGGRGALPPARRHAAVQGLPGRDARSPFPASTCISLNEQVVHGIPGPRRSRSGDLLKIDTACKLNGWCADAAVTLLVGEVRPETAAAGRGRRAGAANWPWWRWRRRWWSEVARPMQQHVETAGFSVVTQYVGHGIGRIMHENPQVPNFVSREVRKHDFRLEQGLVLAVEPMVNMGRPTPTRCATTGRGDPRRAAERPRRAHAGDHRRGRLRRDGGRGDADPAAAHECPASRRQPP